MRLLAEQDVGCSFMITMLTCSQVEANKDQSLARRIQKLQRFLLDKVHNELLQRQRGEQETEASESPAEERQEERGSNKKDEGPKSAVEDTFGMKMKQTMQNLQGTRPTLHKEIQCFQVHCSRQPFKHQTPGLAAPIVTWCFVGSTLFAKV